MLSLHMNPFDWLNYKKMIVYWNLTDNLYYGHLNVLRNYCNKGSRFGIPGLLQHGWSAGPGVYSNIRKDLPFYFCVWNKRNYELTKEMGYNNIKPIGAPFLYLNINQKHAFSKNKKTNNLLLFPLHTWEKEGLLDPVSYFKKYVQEVKKIKNDFDNIHACLYFMEYKNPQIRKVFENADIEVTSLGHREKNPTFLTKFRSLTNNYEYVSSNNLSTSVFYSLCMGKKVFLYGKLPDPCETTWNKSTINIMDNCSNILDLYNVLIWENFDDKPHREIGEYELGSEYKKTKDELIDLFRWGT